MIEIDEALNLVASHAKPTKIEEVSTVEAIGQVLAEDVTADVDSPPHDKSLVDGFAVRVADVNDGQFADGLEIIERVIAGAVPTKPLSAGNGKSSHDRGSYPVGGGSNGNGGTHDQ